MKLNVSFARPEINYYHVANTHCYIKVAEFKKPRVETSARGKALLDITSQLISPSTAKSSSNLKRKCGE